MPALSKITRNHDNNNSHNSHGSWLWNNTLQRNAIRVAQVHSVISNGRKRQVNVSVSPHHNTNSIHDNGETLTLYDTMSYSKSDGSYGHSICNQDYNGKNDDTDTDTDTMIASVDASVSIRYLSTHFTLPLVAHDGSLT